MACRVCQLHSRLGIERVECVSLHACLAPCHEHEDSKESKVHVKKNDLSCLFVFSSCVNELGGHSFPLFLALDLCRFEPGAELVDFLGYSWSVLQKFGSDPPDTGLHKKDGKDWW